MGVVGAGVFLLAAVGCGGNGDGEGGEGDGPAAGPTTDTDTGSSAPAVEPPGWEVVGETSTEPVRFVAEPVWGSDHEGAVSFAQLGLFHEDVAVVVGSDDEGRSGRLDSVDLATGQVLWSLSGSGTLGGGDGAVWWPGGDAPDVLTIDRAGPDGVWAVVVAYRKDIREHPWAELGVAALSGETGEVLWQTPIISVGDERALLLDGIVSAGDTIVALAGADGGASRALTTLAGGDGSVLWEQPGVAREADLGFPPAAVAGDTVLALVDDEGGDGTPATAADHMREQSVVAWDAATGGRRWDLSDRYPRSRLVLTAGDVALVEVPAEVLADEPDNDTGEPADRRELLALEAGTGDELASFGTRTSLAIVFSSCVGDGELLVACTTLDEDRTRRVASFRVEDREAAVSEPLPDLGELVGTHDELVFSWNDETGTGPVVDRAGEVLVDGPGVVRAMSDRYAMVGHPDPGQGGPPRNWPYTILRIDQG